MELAHKLRIYTPRFDLETLQVETRPAGDYILRGTGQFLDGYAPESVAVEEFANCLPELSSVKRFTKRFGPLWLTPNEQSEESQFAFPLATWAADRLRFRLIWDRLLGLEIAKKNLPFLPEGLPLLSKDLSAFRDAQPPWKKVQSKGTFEATKYGLSFVAENLYSALILKLLAVSVDKKLRRCLKPDCNRQTYFIAQHGKQRYCSDICAEWAQRKWKKEWWADKGHGYRRPDATSLRPAKKRGTNVPKKAR